MEINMEALNNQLATTAAQNNAASLQAAREQMAFQVAQNAKAMSFNADQARINREWQEMLSSTAHQREVKDLIAAGLNPVLSANNGASTPAGSMASGVTSAGSMATVDQSRNAALSNILTSIIAGDVAKHNAQLQAETSIANALTSAKAVTDSAAINAAASRYATDHPNTQAGLIRIALGQFSDSTGVTVPKIVDAVTEGAENAPSYLEQIIDEIKETGWINTASRAWKDMIRYFRVKDDQGKPDPGNDWI